MMVRAASMFPPELLAKSARGPLRYGSAAPPRTPWGMYAGITAILVACGLGARRVLAGLEQHGAS